jgi:parallel beta-helix repeat protein
MLRQLLGTVANSVRPTSVHNRTRKNASRSRRLFLENLETRNLLATIVVDDDMADCKKAEYETIQEAVDVAQPGDKIEVCEGTYVEEVTVPLGKDDLELRSKKKLAAVIQAPPASTSRGIVDIAANDVTLRGFTIAGPSSNISGVFVEGTNANITENHITAIRQDPLTGAQLGIGILVGRESFSAVGTATIRKNLIDDYQKGGIVVDGPGSSAVIQDNDIIGAGPTTTGPAQNGIQISRGATAEIRKNLVTGNDYIGTQAATAAGILLFQSGAVTIEHNDVDENEVGIYLDGATLSLLANNKVRDNRRHGIFLTNDSDDNEIRNNKVNDNGEDGIHVTGDSSGNQITENKLNGNAGFDAYDDTVGTGTAGTANFWEENKGDDENRPGLLDS